MCYFRWWSSQVKETEWYDEVEPGVKMEIIAISWLVFQVVGLQTFITL